MSAKRPSSSWKFIKVGLPFFAIMGGSVFALNLVQDIRYEFRKQKHQQHAFNELKTDLTASGMRVRENISENTIYEEILDLDTDNWDNIRGPRPYEENKQFLKAKEKTEIEAKEKRVKFQTERLKRLEEIHNQVK